MSDFADTKNEYLQQYLYDFFLQNNVFHRYIIFTIL